MTKAEDAISHEADNGDENDAGDPERNDDGVIDILPVRGDWRPPPRAQEVEHHRSNCDQKQYERDTHAALPLPLRFGYEPD